VNGAGRLAKLPCGRVAKWIVLVFWVLVLAVAGPLAGKLTGAEKNDAASWLPVSAESTQVLKLAEKFQSSNEIPALIVYERRSGITPADQAAVAADVPEFAGVKYVDQPVIGPIPSKDGQALQVVVQVNAGSGGWQSVGTAVEQIRAIAGDDGLTVHVTGPGGSAADSADAFKGIESTLLYAALGVVIVILLLTYRSPSLWLLPVITAVTALTTAQAVIYLLAKNAGLTVNAQSAGILTVLVFGAGTDYALLLVARYREELRRHEDRHEAMAIALHRAGPAIFASASTVILSMLCLVVAEMNSTKGLGPVAAIGIAVGLLAMLTLLPALLVVVGRWIFWPVRPTFGSQDHTATGVWARTGAVIARRPRVVWMTTTVVLAAIAVGITGLNAHGLANKDSFIGKPDSIVGAEVLARHYPAGSGQPAIVITRADGAGAVQAAAIVSQTPGVAQVATPVVKDGYAYLLATLSDAPDSSAAQATVDRLRAAVHAVPGADAKVGGDTALILDTERAAAHDNRVIIPIVLVVVFLVLTVLLRALVAPVVLIATVVLSFLTALGLSALAFQHVFGFKGADASLPLFVFVFLVALGIDYNIFLMTRVHEESKKFGMRRGALIGLAATGGVITSAGLVLAGTFAVLATLPLVAFAEIGFAVAVGVLIDTIIVRSVLVTALNLDIGPRMWWPSRLAREDGVGAEEPGLEQPTLVH